MHWQYRRSAGRVGFSLRPILIKLAYGYVNDPVTLLALRMIFSAPFFVLAALWAGGGASRRMTRRDLVATAALGALGYDFPGSPWYMDSYALVENGALPDQDRPGMLRRVWQSVF